MRHSPHNKLSKKVLEKTILDSIKQEIASGEINTFTRQGNKELKFLTGKIAKYPFDRYDRAKIAGTKLGRYIVDISLKKGKKKLDAGIIQQIIYRRNLFVLAGLLTEKNILDSEDLATKAVSSIDNNFKREKIENDISIINNFSPH
jgi:hypothetical protein